jgi:hypothetical protein
MENRQRVMERRQFWSKNSTKIKNANLEKTGTFLKVT